MNLYEFTNTIQSPFFNKLFGRIKVFDVNDNLDGHNNSIEYWRGRRGDGRGGGSKVKGLGGGVQDDVKVNAI